MAPRFEAEERVLHLSVQDLLDTSLLRSLGFSGRGGYERMWLGQALHSRYQQAEAARDPSYRAEVPLELTFEHRGWRVMLGGRVDGLRRRDDGGLLLEEIKSVRQADRVAAPLRELYVRQALLYAWMLERSGEAGVEAELVWIEIASGDTHREPVASAPELEEEIRRRLNSLIGGWHVRQSARARRRDAAAGLRFPYPELRPGQQEIVEAVEHAVEYGEQLLIEAPTGLGKTVAALFPALRWSLANDRRVMVLTAKTLQQEMATTVVQMLNDGAFHALRLRAKARMCANDELLCHEEYCRFASDYYLKLQRTGIVDDLSAAHPTLLPDDIFAAARDCEVCPFETSLELAGRSEVLIGDFNYAFDPYVALSELREEGGAEEFVLVIDEIHNLVDRGRGYWSPALDASTARQAAAALRRSRSLPTTELVELCDELHGLIEETVDRELQGRVGAVEARLPEDRLWELRGRFDHGFVEYLEHRRQSGEFRAEDPFVDLYFRLVRFLDVIEQSGDEAFSHCLERDREDARLRILCKDPSRLLARLFDRVHAVVGLSGTLSPPEFYRDLLGLDRDRFASLSIPGPFPRDNRRIVIDTAVGTAWREREANYGPIAEHLARFVLEVPGNVLALFPSYDFLEQVGRRLPRLPRSVLIQGRSDAQETRERFLEHLRSPLSGDTLLLAVAGGVFAEGVDYPGEMLRAVAVIGPCLPAVNLEQQLLRAYYEERFQRGFEYAFVVPGMTRVVQAAGRLIRSRRDTGVIALFDHRFLRRPYVDFLPADWIDGRPADELAGDPAAVAAGFFRDVAAD